MISRPDTALTDFTSNLKGYRSHKCNVPLQKLKALGNGLTELAHSGQFLGRTWLPYTRIAQLTDST